MKGFVQKLFLSLLGYRWMDVYLAGITRDYYEDPRCPWDWRGSGCYEVPVYVTSGVHLEVFARDVEKAKKLAIEEAHSNHKDYGHLMVIGVCPRPFSLDDDICSEYINYCEELDSRDEMGTFSTRELAERYLRLSDLKYEFKFA